MSQGRLWGWQSGTNCPFKDASGEQIVSASPAQDTFLNSLLFPFCNLPHAAAILDGEGVTLPSIFLFTVGALFGMPKIPETTRMVRQLRMARVVTFDEA